MSIANESTRLLKEAWDPMEDLAQYRSQSIWNGFTGDSMKSPIIKKDINLAVVGNKVNLSYSLPLTKGFIQGKEQKIGTGEKRIAFDGDLEIDKLVLTADIPDWYETTEIGAMKWADIASTRGDLSLNYIRQIDQAFFDTFQGLHKVRKSGVWDIPKGKMQMPATFTMSNIKELYNVATTGIMPAGSSIVRREPLIPFKLFDNGMPMYVLIVDSNMALRLRSQPDYISYCNVDLRGRENLLFTGIIGKIDNILVIEAPICVSDLNSDMIESSGVGTLREIGFPFAGASRTSLAGLRFQDTAGLWTGEKGFSYHNPFKHRGILLGAGGLTHAVASTPAPTFRLEKKEYDQGAEIAMFSYSEMKKTSYSESVGRDNPNLRATGIDYGCIVIDFLV